MHWHVFVEERREPAVHFVQRFGSSQEAQSGSVPVQGEEMERGREIKRKTEKIRERRMEYYKREKLEQIWKRSSRWSLNAGLCFEGNSNKKYNF